MNMHPFKALVGLICSSQFWASQAAEPTNAPPQVRIVYPYPEGSVYLWGGTVKLIAEATDPDGSVAKVEFFKDGVSLAVVTNSPYVFRWPTYTEDWNVTVRLTARAYDDQGLYTDSAALPIFITQDIAGPQVVLAEPKDGALVSTHQSLRVLVKMYQTDDAWGEVELLRGTDVVAQSSDPPYEFSLGPFSPGEYSFQARGRVYFNPWSVSSTARVRVIDLRLGQPAISNGIFQFQIEGLPTNQVYGVQVSSNLLQWKQVSTNSASGQVERFSETLSDTIGTRFYRAVVPPP